MSAHSRKGPGRPGRPSLRSPHVSAHADPHSHCATCSSRAAGVFEPLQGTDLSRLNDARSTRLYRRGATIFLEGSRIGGLYCVRSGSVKVYKSADDGRRYALRIAGCGEVLGLSSLLTDGTAHAGAEMLQDGFLCFTSRNVILDLLVRSPALAGSVMTLLAARIVESEDERLALVRRSVGRLLARLLLLLGQTHGAVRGAGLAIDLELSIEELSEMLGSTRETTNRCLSRLRREGIVLREGRRLVIQDPARLERLALRPGR